MNLALRCFLGTWALIHYVFRHFMIMIIMLLPHTHTHTHLDNMCLMYSWDINVLLYMKHLMTYLKKGFVPS